MIDRRWPWWVAAGLLLTSGAVAAWASWLWWEPCRGAVLAATVLRGGDTSGLSSECLVRMNSGWAFAPAEATPGLERSVEAATLAIVLAAAAWCVVVLAVISGARARLLMLPLAVALLAVASARIGGGGGNGLWLLAVDACAVLALVAMLRIRALDWRALVVWAGVCAYGFTGSISDYLTMTSWSAANWDVPPGTGVLTASLVATAGGIVGLRTLMTERSPAAPVSAA